MTLGEVGVAPRHGLRLVAQKVTNGLEVHATFSKRSRHIVTEIMKMEVLDLGSFRGKSKLPLYPILLHWRLVRSQEDSVATASLWPTTDDLLKHLPRQRLGRRRFHSPSCPARTGSTAFSAGCDIA